MADRLFRSVLLLNQGAEHEAEVRTALELCCLQVTTAGLSGAPDRISGLHPDLLAIDLDIPGAAAAAAAFASAADAPPIIVLAAPDALGAALNALRAGARDYLIKDFASDFSGMLRFVLTRLAAALAHDEEKRRLNHGMEVLRLAAQNSREGLAVIGADGRVEYANRTFRAFAGRCGGSDGSLLDLLSPKVRNAALLKAQLAEKLQELVVGGFWHFELGLIDCPGAAFEINLSVLTASLDADGIVQKECVVWMSDMAKLKRREELQREIISTTTHDLKGPLGAIALSADLLCSLTQPGQAQELAVRIGSSAQGALQMIDRFLSAKRIQAGSLVLKPVMQSIEPLIAKVVDTFRPIILARRIEVQSQADETCRASVDGLAFERAVGNLLANALKFTNPGGRIWLRAAEQGDCVHVEVQDTGSGMEPSEVQALFEPFARLERHAEIEGSGMGLFIVRSIVAAHGGKVDVTSRLHEGTTFTLTLPKTPPVNQHGELFSLDMA